MRTTWRLLSIVTTLASTASAQESTQVAMGVSAQSPPASSTPSPKRTSGIRLHDGFYFRFAGGFGAYQERIFRKVGSDEPHTSVTGMGTAGEVAIGGSVSRKVVLGGGLWTMTALATDVTTSTGAASSAAIPPGVSASPSLTLLGPFLAYYFDPAEGFALQFALGVASVREADPGGGRFDRTGVALGAGGLFGIGYEWWVGDQWSLGVAWRLTGAITTQKTDGQQLTHLVATAPVALFTATYH